MTDLTLNNGGVRLAASVRGAADAPPILMLHGISLCRDTWDEIACALADRHQVWTLDLRGHGHSDHSPTYTLDDYRSDVLAALAAIGRPTVLVGHSLGACVAGMLAQQAHPAVRAVFLEDPPWYLGEPGEWQRAAFPAAFAVVSARQAGWQAAAAPLSVYLAFVTRSPCPMGGVNADHFGTRHLLSHASALQRQDNRCWGDLAADASAGASLLAAIDTTQPLRCPATVVAADPRMGAALLDGHDTRMRATTPDLEWLAYAGSGHSPHRSLAFAARFADDLQRFLLRYAG